MLPVLSATLHENIYFASHLFGKNNLFIFLLYRRACYKTYNGRLVCLQFNFHPSPFYCIFHTRDKIKDHRFLHRSSYITIKKKIYNNSN